MESNNLTVSISSFSYKKGYPSAEGGNGGGFMFDCRFLNNPGRYEEYKSLTGKDPEVIEFLKTRSDIDKFLKSAWEIIDAAVHNYVERGFSSIQIGFGCTGGQHRSVYSADETAKHIRTKFPEVKVNLTHREQNF